MVLMHSNRQGIVLVFNIATNSVQRVSHIMELKCHNSVFTSSTADLDDGPGPRMTGQRPGDRNACPGTNRFLITLIQNRLRVGK